MIETKVYLYDSSKSDYKGTDYSANVLAGNGWADDLTETLDIASLTLVGLPFSEEFDPTTKFIVELWDTNVNNEFPYETLCLAVEEDVVSQPVLSDDHYFNHSISFNEASVIAQGRVVDNCSETFELKNVNINDESVYNPNAMADGKIIPSATNDSVCAYRETTHLIFSHSENITFKRKFSWVFTEEYLQPTDPNYGQASAWGDVKMYIPISGGEQVKLPIPLLGTQFGAKDSADYESHVNLCSVEVKVYESSDGVEWSEMTALSKVVNPCSSNIRENDWQTDWRLTERINSPANTKGYGINRAYGLSGEMREYYKKYAKYDVTMGDRFVTIPLQADKQYCVIVAPKITSTSLYELGTHEEQHIGMSNRLLGDPENNYYTFSYAFSSAHLSPVSGLVLSNNNSSQAIIAPTIQDETGMPMLKMQFSTFVAGSNVSAFLKSAPALSAYDLFRDALLKSQTTKKVVGTYIKDTPLAYYCDPNDIGIMQNTEIIESSFNQKNLWEILLEVGKYIHAIPYIEFGEDDRFVVRWRYLGQPDQYEDKGHRISIFNSRSIENYVGALNSYVTNMVQRGAQIEEWIAPKSESDDYLVYNDVVVLQTAKPIIELLKLEFGLSGSSTLYNITDNIFEHNVYELLAVVDTVVPNKGLGIYYNLGENVIRGLNYQLPAANAGAPEREYAIKRIMGKAMGMPQANWKDIKVNDYVFKVTYRTKEEVRSEQSRPDLRKYLINSKYERVPHHKQFNNQQDKMVDSVKFGNQTYGKLIKTGNTEYKTTEWNDNLYDLKKSGQLINIRGNIYYVARAEHSFFQDHIISEITYSKDYNKLSEIIGIPSEPRFFEISEQSQVDRHVSFNHFLCVHTEDLPSVENPEDERPMFYLDGTSLKNLLFGNVAYPKYALIQIKNDIDNPSPEQGLSLFSKDFALPIGAYSMRNTLTLKWEMKDNFSAGDRVEPTVGYRDPSRQTDTNYATLKPTQYTDVFGRADLIDFVIINDLPSLTAGQIRNLPLSPYRILLSSATGPDYGSGSAFSNLRYYTRYNGDDTVYHNITSNTRSFSIAYGSNVIGPWGDIVDSNDDSILPQQDLDEGEYFILEYNGAYSLFLCSTEDHVTFTFSNVYTTSELQELLDILATPSINHVLNTGNEFVSTETITDDLFGTNAHGLALVKDNRERMIFNYNLQMLTDSDRFVLSGFLWQQNKGTISVAVLDREVNKICGNTIPTESIKLTFPIDDIYDIDFDYILGNVPLGGYYKAIALISDKVPKVGGGKETYFVIARNIDGLSNEEAHKNWTISTIDSAFFKKQ